MKFKIGELVYHTGGRYRGGNWSGVKRTGRVVWRSNRLTRVRFHGRSKNYLKTHPESSGIITLTIPNNLLRKSK